MSKWAEELDALIAEAGMVVVFWMCPLHPEPVELMTTVVWNEDKTDATCQLCGFTKAEHDRHFEAARAKARLVGCE